MDSTEEKNLLIEQESNEVTCELDEEAQLKLKVIQTLLEPCKGTVSDTRDRMKLVLKKCCVEMLIIDEANRLKAKTFDEVRDIFDGLDIAVVLVGTDRLNNVVQNYEEVYNRFRACYRFGKLSGNDFADTVDIWEKQILKLPVASNLTGKRKMTVLKESTGGYIGLLDMVLREAAIRALKKGSSKIDLATLKEVAGEYK